MSAIGEKHFTEHADTHLGCQRGSRSKPSEVFILKLKRHLWFRPVSFLIVSCLMGVLYGWRWTAAQNFLTSALSAMNVYSRSQGVYTGDMISNKGSWYCFGSICNLKWEEEAVCWTTFLVSHLLCIISSDMFGFGQGCYTTHLLHLYLLHKYSEWY